MTASPDEVWMMQMARNVTDAQDGFLRGKTHFILDRDTKYTTAFQRTLEREGVSIVQLPPRSPNLNSFAERFVRSIKEECLNRLMFFSQAQLRHVISQYMIHYHEERNHQGIGNELIRRKKPLRVVINSIAVRSNGASGLEGFLIFTIGRLREVVRP